MINNAQMAQALNAANVRNAGQAIVHPGIILRDKFMYPKGLNTASLAALTDVSEATIESIIRGETAINTVLAISLAKPLGVTSVYWCKLQNDLEGSYYWLIHKNPSNKNSRPTL